MQSDLFKKVNIAEIERDLHLIEDAEGAAKQGLPLLDSTVLDSAERRIVGRIEQAGSDAQDTGARVLASHGKRLIDLDPEFRNLSHSIDSETSNGLEKLRQEADKAGEDLRSRQRDLWEAEKALTTFQEENIINREAHERSHAQRVFSIGTIAVLFLIETLGNAVFLAKGNELGLFGAYTEAILISFVNLGIAFLLGRLATNYVCVRWSRKSVGILVAIAFVVFAFFFNLMVAHYREITGTVLDEGGQLAISAFRENPIGLRDFQSWMLFFMGFLFAIISFIDGIMWNDPYPGYSKVFFDYRDQDEEYKDMYDKYQENLKNISNEAVERLNRINQKLMGYEKERSSILTARKHVIEWYEDHLDHLEHAGNDLLMRYRELNRERRGGEAPYRFKEPWIMERSTIDRTLPEGLLTHEEIAEIISEATARVDDRVKELRKECANVCGDLRRNLAPHRLQT